MRLTYQNFEQIGNQYLCSGCNQLFPKSKITNHYLHWHTDKFQEVKKNILKYNKKQQAKSIFRTHKICRCCKKEKLIFEFPKKSTLCKCCTKTYNQKWYGKEENKQKTKRKVNISKEKQKEKLQQYVYNYLLKHPCTDCGNSDPLVLQFDHLKDKRSTIAKLVANVVSLDSLKKEIEKCEIRCANCHILKTAKDFNWFIYALWKNDISSI